MTKGHEAANARLNRIQNDLTRDGEQGYLTPATLGMMQLNVQVEIARALIEISEELGSLNMNGLGVFQP